MTSNNNLNVEKNKVEVSKNVPDLRFQGFIDDWEQRKLGDISDKVKEKNKTGEFTETLTNSAEHGIINQRDFFDKDISNAKNLDGYYVVKNDDFVYNPRISNFAPVGPIKRNKLGRTGVMSPLYYVFRTHDIDKEYFEKYFDTVYWHRFMELNGDSGARADRFAIKDSVFVDMPIPYPNMDEQQKIGTFFKQLDDTIDLHQRKLEKLKRLKQGYLQQLFPQNDEKVPIVRFANFEDELKQRKLGEISRMYQPLTITGNDLLPDGVPVFGANGFIGFFSEANHIDDQVTISARGEGTGTPSYVHGPVWITGNSMVVNVDDFDIDKYFLFANLTANSLKKYVTGGAQPQLTRDVLVKVPITLPNADEQEKIGSFFKQLDETITLHHSKLDKLNLLKQALLQKMFI